jgi:hypothetical protein
VVTVGEQLERVDRLTAPPVVGRFYLVPCVRGEWNSKVAWWPVAGGIHNDAEFFAFKEDHYHLDPRFMTDADLDRGDPEKHPLSWRPALGPLAETPTLLRRKCKRAGVMYRHGHRPEAQGLRATFAGRTCARNAQGLICPHRHYGLGSIAPNENGIITCPLHGLMIGADGAVLRQMPGDRADA